MEIGLAERIDYDWYNVENKTANELMFLLSSVIADKIQSIAATDKIDYSFSRIYVQNDDVELRNRQYKRDLILKNLIPYPKQIDLTNLRRFKEKHHDLLTAFRNKVESIVLNQAIYPESEIFEVILDGLKNQKEELSARMCESHLGGIHFGTVCGTILEFFPEICYVCALAFLESGRSFLVPSAVYPCNFPLFSLFVGFF